MRNDALAAVLAAPLAVPLLASAAASTAAMAAAAEPSPCFTLAASATAFTAGALGVGRFAAATAPRVPTIASWYSFSDARFSFLRSGRLATGALLASCCAATTFSALAASSYARNRRNAWSFSYCSRENAVTDLSGREGGEDDDDGGGGGGDDDEEEEEEEEDGQRARICGRWGGGDG